MGKPDEGTVVIEPVENGWLVQVWEEPEDDEMECMEDHSEDDEDDEDGYDPSAAFAASQRQRPTPEQQHRMVTHLHMHDHGPEPYRYVFEDTQAMTAFVAEKTLAFATRREAMREAIAKRKAEREG